MKQNKDKRIRELKEEVRVNDRLITTLLAVLSIALVSFVIFVIVVQFQKGNLEQELESYQEKVPVWTLKAECKYPLIDFYHYSEKNYTDYEEYLEGKQRVIDFENCEVISE